MEVDKIARKIIDQNLAEGNDDAFCISNLEEVKLKHNHWIEKFPRINPYYSVRSNSNEEVLKLLRDLGVGFNCGSKSEILQVLALNVDPKRIICSHTVKEVSFLKLLAEKGVDMLAFDSVAELKKIKKYHPKAKVLLRIKFDATDSIVNLGTKLGCNPETEAHNLIKSCKELKINLVGIAFHVGLVLTDHEVYERALDTVRKLFDYAESLDMKLKFVDIGGGFIGRDPEIFDNYARSINSGIEKNFPSIEVQIIAEPGSGFICASCNSIEISRFKNVVQCNCSESDSIVSNRVVCYRSNEPLFCKGFTGKCCDNDNDVCPLCSKDFTRSADCGCDTLQLKLKIFPVPVTRVLDKLANASAYCCDDIDIQQSTIEPPAGRRKIIPYKKFAYRNAWTELDNPPDTGFSIGLGFDPNAEPNDDEEISTTTVKQNVFRARYLRKFKFP
ncbi:ornithine decarboxylase 2-like [Chironomus tepperi]|uniref:ornithine decarboxylase 2-like n=1 Tax=Chironomus tepperi TaxID=113505 RepID=UPI00391F2AD8